MGITPSEGHMVHMPGHIWLVLGEWEMAAAVNERAAEVDRQYFATTGVTEGSYPMYYMHNLHFIAYARWMQGRKADSLKADDTLAKAMAPMAEAMPEMADPYLPFPKFGPLRFNDWDAVLKQPKPKDAQKISTAMWHYSRALAFAARRDTANAAAEQSAFEAIRKQLPADSQWGQNKTSAVFAMASEILAARRAMTPWPISAARSNYRTPSSTTSPPPGITPSANLSARPSSAPAALPRPKRSFAKASAARPKTAGCCSV